MEVKRWQLKGLISGVEGESRAVLKPWVVLAEDFDRVIAERDQLHVRLTEAEQKADDLLTQLNLSTQRVRDLTEGNGALRIRIANLERALAGMLHKFEWQVATGEQLDAIGEMYGVARDGKSDDAYRREIAERIIPSGRSPAEQHQSEPACPDGSDCCIDGHSHWCPNHPRSASAERDELARQLYELGRIPLTWPDHFREQLLVLLHLMTGIERKP